MPRPLPSLVGLAILAACGNTGAPTRAATTRDSAGVAIVESPTSAWGDRSPWQVDSIPQLSIGSEDGDDAYQFSRVAGALRRDDGSIVVGDMLARELRLYDAEGRHLSSHGRRGPGPGEFSLLSRLSRCSSDEIWVDTDARLSVWSLDSVAFRREFTLTDNAMWPLNCFDGAALLVQQSRGFDPSAAPLNTPFVDSLLFKVVDSSGSPRATLFTLPLRDYMMVMVPEGGRGFVPPFSRTTVLRSNADRLVVGLAKELRLDEYDLSGQWVRSLRGPVEDLTLTDAWRDRYRAAPLVRQDSMIRDWFEAGGSPFPDQIPAYTDLVRDADGHLWVRRFAVPIDQENRWGVFAPDGVFLGHVSLPAGLELFEIGRDYVLGVARDEDGVQQVRLHRILKQP